MQTYQHSSIIKSLILAERGINAQFRKLTGLNRTRVEVLTFAFDVLTFSIYEVQKHFRHTNVQIIRRSIKSLLEAKLIECVGCTGIQKASVYMITNKGRQSFEDYVKQWTNVLF